MSTKIEWADETINPLGWGCYGPTGSKDNPRPCSYCYARDFAKRHLRGCPDCDAFIPHWHQKEIEKPAHWRKPKRIFVQSMGDLFHKDTPKAHIDATLAACRANPQHTYQFLTKNPKGFNKRLFPKNAWIGTSITDAGLLINAQKGIACVRLAKKRNFTQDLLSFISLEPLLGSVEGLDFSGIDLLIVGAMTGPGAVKPKKEWLESVIATGHPNILWKKNVQPYLKEYGLVT